MLIDGEKTWGIIVGEPMIETNMQTPMHTPRMVINAVDESLVSFKFEVLYTPIVSGYVPADNIRFHQLLKSLLPESGYFMCQGIPVESSSQMTYKSKSARFWGMPFGRVDHKDCPLWLIAVTATGL